MIDTIHLWLPLEQSGRVNLPDVVSSRLTQATQVKKDNGDVWIKGRLNNLIVGANNFGVSIKGSLSRYKIHNNIFDSPLKEIKYSVESISDELRMSVNHAKLTRIDMAENLEMRYLPNTYYPYLGICPYYIRLLQPKSLYYQNSLRVMHFYDKIAQSKNERIQIPENWQMKHILRYELRFVKNLPRQFNQTKVLLSDIYNENFYYNLRERWFSEFSSIRKEKVYLDGFENIKNLKSFQAFAYSHLIQSMGGETAALERVAEINKQGIFENRVQYKRMKDFIKLNSHRSINTVESDLVKELESKIQEVKVS